MLSKMNRILAWHWFQTTSLYIKRLLRVGNSFKSNQSISFLCQELSLSIKNTLSPCNEPCSENELLPNSEMAQYFSIRCLFSKDTFLQTTQFFANEACRYFLISFRKMLRHYYAFPMRPSSFQFFYKTLRRAVKLWGQLCCHIPLKFFRHKNFNHILSHCLLLF